MGRSVFEYHEQQMRDNPEYKAAYDALEQEFAIANALIQARSEAGMTQKDVAEKLGVSQPAVARMESGILWENSFIISRVTSTAASIPSTVMCS